MKNNIKTKKIKLKIEYYNALGMPVTVTKKVTPDELQDFLENNASMISEGCINYRKVC